MFSMGGAGKFPTRIEMPVGYSQPLEALRDTALWYPRIPDSCLHVNEVSFTGEDPLALGYRPLCWTLFGGSGGIIFDL